VIRDPIQSRRAEMALENAWESEESGDELVLHRLRLEKVLPEIRGQLREILRLAMDGLNHREIANRMGVSRVAITRRLTRFKKELAAMGVDREAAFVRAARKRVSVEAAPALIRARVAHREAAAELALDTAYAPEARLIAA